MKATEASPLEVAVMKVQPEMFPTTVPVTGTLVSTSAVDVKAETVGRVVRFDKMEGQAVAAGETVVWLDEENYQLALRQAESAVQVSEAFLEKARVMEGHSSSELERARNLLQSGGITDKDLKASQVAERDSHAQVNLATAQLEQARATFKVAQKHLRDCQIRAPVTGRMQKKFVNPGAYVEAQTPLFALVDNRSLELESQVASADLGPVAPGQKVTFSVNSFPGQVFGGRVREVSPAVDTQTRSAKVRIQADNSSGRLKAGMFAEGEIITGVEAQAIIIPASAAYREDRSVKESSVFVVQNNQAARRNVRIGREGDLKLQIVEGLQPGDLVVIQQSVELADGVRVRPRL